MERLNADSWSLGDTPSVTSFFKLPLTDGHSPDIDKGLIFTGSCGLGWRFAVSAMHADTREQMWGEARTVQKTAYRIYFAPHLVATADLGDLSVAIITENLYQHVNGSTTISLPTSSEKIPLASYFSTENFTGNATVAIQVNLQSSFSLSPISEPPLPKLQQALCNSLAGEEFGDIKFYFYPRRNAQNPASPAQPQVMFANSSLLRGYCAYLDKLLDTKEDTVMSHDAANLTSGAYDYDEDSDLDSDEGEEDADYQEIGISAGKEAGSEEKEKRKRTCQAGATERAILISDTAFKTWKSFVFYLYTREINLRPLTSRVTFEGPPPSSGAPLPPGFESNVSGLPPQCSPKSMYRLAHKIGSSELQALALAAIARDLTEDNIVHEVFSRFTSMHTEVQKVEVDYLISHLTSRVFEDLLEKMKIVISGSLPHCFDVVAAIMHKMNTRGSHTGTVSR
ncbi:hypothetical protein FPV67DRAFT_1153495 [Lyophyllum atratum]|nr:hypothetical protein FPV67DRAFT_1153495 [Lyophyllum atratum]